MLRATFAEFILFYYPRRHVTDHEASAAAIDDPLTYAFVAKAAYEPASVLVAAHVRTCSMTTSM
jgi:hypothetical protein